MDDEDVAYAPRFLAWSERLSIAAIVSKMEVGKTTVWRAVSARGQARQDVRSLHTNFGRYARGGKPCDGHPDHYT